MLYTEDMQYLSRTKYARFAKENRIKHGVALHNIHSRGRFIGVGTRRSERRPA